jgi:4-hydroxy-tetrahydrodipicolinate synthase
VVIPETIVALYEAVRKDDMEAARAAHAIIYPLAKAIYGTPPGGYATARLKTCLKLLGKLDNDLVRPPIGPLPAEEVTMLCSVLETTGLLS